MTGDSASELGLDGAFSGGRGEASRICGARIWGLGGMVLVDTPSGDGSFGEGAAGNLNVCEKERDGFRDVIGSAGVFGAVAWPGGLRAGRAGRSNP